MKFLSSTLTSSILRCFGRWQMYAFLTLPWPKPSLSRFMQFISLLPRWSITSKIYLFTRFYICINCIFASYRVKLHFCELSSFLLNLVCYGLRADSRRLVYLCLPACLYQPTGQSLHELFVNFETWVHTCLRCFKNNSK